MIIAKELRWSNMFSFGSENVIKFDQRKSCSASWGQWSRKKLNRPNTRRSTL